jgi:hypothetical protein
VDPARAAAERELDVHAVDPRHARVGGDLDGAVAGDELAEALQRAGLDVHAAEGEDRALRIVRANVGDLLVEPPALCVEAPEGGLVLRERARRAPDARPCILDAHVEEHGHGSVGKQAPDGLREHGAAAERIHARPDGRQERQRGALLERPELRLAAGEEVGDRRSCALLDRVVEVDERATEALGQLTADRRLARAHEADEDDVTVQDVDSRPR